MIVKGRTVLRPSEEDEQIVVVQYLSYKGVLFHHSPNEGKRSNRTGAKLRDMGMKRGFPDLFIFEPRGDHHGLAIEMKTKTGRVSAEQKEWISFLKAKGYAACVCRSAEEAIKVIDKYLSKPRREKG